MIRDEIRSEECELLNQTVHKNKISMKDRMNNSIVFQNYNGKGERWIDCFKSFLS
jgi:hypothetical protein